MEKWRTLALLRLKSQVPMLRQKSGRPKVRVSELLLEQLRVMAKVKVAVWSLKWKPKEMGKHYLKGVPSETPERIETAS
jgi:hypothetical protein